MVLWAGAPLTFGVIKYFFWLRSFWTWIEFTCCEFELIYWIAGIGTIVLSGVTSRLVLPRDCAIDELWPITFNGCCC